MGSYFGSVGSYFESVGSYFGSVGRRWGRYLGSGVRHGFLHVCKHTHMGNHQLTASVFVMIHMLNYAGLFHVHGVNVTSEFFSIEDFTLVL